MHHHEFRGQADHEIVLYSTRAHWIALLGRLVLDVLSWGLVGLVVVLALNAAEGDGVSMSLMVQKPWLLYLWLATIVSGVLYAFTMWYLTMMVITDRRIIEFVQRGLFSSFALDLKFENIKDSAYSYRNPIHYIFNCGALVVRSSPSAIKRFEINNIPNPRDVHHYMNKLMMLIEEARRDNRAPVLPQFKRKWGKRHWRKEMQYESVRQHGTTSAKASDDRTDEIDI